MSTESREERPPIVVCRPFLKPLAKHLDHFTEWYAANQEKHNLRLTPGTYFQALHKAQQMALNLAYKVGASHILFTEDDQWGYPVDGLDVLLEADKDVIGFRTYKRDMPFLNMCFHKERPEVSLIAPVKEQIEEVDGKRGRIIPFGRGDGPEIQKCDLITWAFTLVKMDVFRKMGKAWGNRLVSQQFIRRLLDGDPDARKEAERISAEPDGLEPFRQWGPHPTDSFFCQYCEDLGIDRWVHFGYTIGHGNTEPEDIILERRKEEARNLAAGIRPDVEMVPVEDDFGNPYGPDVRHVPETVQVMRFTPEKMVIDGGRYGEVENNAEHAGAQGGEGYTRPAGQSQTCKTGQAADKRARADAFFGAES